MEVITTTNETIPVVTESFKLIEWREYKVKIVRFDGTVQFQWEIPKYILDEAKRINPEKYGKHPLFIRCSNLTHLKDMASDIAEEIEKAHAFEGTYGDKVLFIHFSGNHNPTRDYNHGGGTGIKVNITFQFFVGYKFVGQVKKWMSNEYSTVERYHSEYQLGLGESLANRSYKVGQLVPIHGSDTTIEALKARYKIVPYTEEREQYLKEIEERFVTLTDNLNDFLANLDGEKLDRLISEFPVQKMLGSGNNS